MSRSTKKPYFTDQNSGKPQKGFAKRIAAKSIRNGNKKACKQDPDKEVANGKAFRKVSNSYDIRDWSFPDPKNPKSKRK